jgi:hypothetical protein
MFALYHIYKNREARRFGGLGFPSYSPAEALAKVGLLLLAGVH